MFESSLERTSSELRHALKYTPLIYLLKRKVRTEICRGCQNKDAPWRLLPISSQPGQIEAFSANLIKKCT